MSRFRVEISYRTKRGAWCCGMEVEALTVRAALKAGKAKVLKGRPARKLVGACARSLDILELGQRREVAVFEMKVER